MDGGLYKYTYGSSHSQEEITPTLREVRRKFKDAFVIELVDGQRVK
jgi:N-acetylmuramoyl-L-alanine amidase